MLQRSTHDSPVDIPAIPATVQPGETIDWPIPIAGFEPVPPDPDQQPAKTSKKAAATPASTGEEPAP
ncbi:hypothetical protein [Kitasatospora sp. NPDC127116]|uniref:hypothetical protein n=1 Tax=Kitasatospora sp. NPDC127116 TaxID=3345367 RepID=UPI0036428675